MRLLIYSDPHLGVKRQAHTTYKSAADLRRKVFETPFTFLETSKRECARALCLGDLFDSFSNDEATLLEGLQLWESTTYIMAGNHDVSGRADEVSSLALLMEATGGENIMITPYGEAAVFERREGSTTFFFVPHTATQELFEQSLREAERRAKLSPPAWFVLCLHCNYNLPPERVSETTLNLTEELAYPLLNTFHRILIGHEHQARAPIPDRIQMLGNTHPTSFSDIGDKFFWVYDTDTGALEQRICWNRDEKHLKSKASLVAADAAGGVPFFDLVQFFDLEDDMPPGKASALVTGLFKKPNTLAVRLSRNESVQGREIAAQLDQLDDLPELIEADLQKNHPALLPLFKEFVHAAQNSDP